MKNTHRLFLTSALAAVILLSNASPAHAVSCTVTNFQMNTNEIRNIILGGDMTTNLKEQVVGATSAMAEQGNLDAVQERAENEAKKVEEMAQNYRDAESDKAREAGKEYNKLLDEHAPDPIADCAITTAALADDYNRIAFQNDANNLTKTHNDMIRAGAPGGASKVQIDFFKEEQEARKGNRRAEFSATLAGARNDCTTVECFNAALKNMVRRAQAMGASDRAPYTAKLNKELGDYIKKRGAWEAAQGEASLNLETILPRMFVSLSNYNDVVGYFTAVNDGDEARAKSIVHARWFNSDKVGMSEIEKNEALLLAMTRQAGIRGNQMNNAQLERFGTNINELKERVRDDRQALKEFNQYLQVLMTPAPGVSAGAVSIQ